MYVPVVTAARFEGHIGHGNTFLQERGKIALSREIPGVCVVGLSHREEDGLCIGFDRTCGHAFGIPVPYLFLSRERSPLWGHPA